jgi:membrane protease YdiL (CAAX protease family)
MQHNHLNQNVRMYQQAGPLGRKEQIIEVLVFLLLIVPSMALSFFAVKQGSIGFTLTAVATILRDAALVSLILFFLWRNGESIKAIGWQSKRWWLDILLGILVFPVMFFGAVLLERLLISIGFTVPSTPTPSLQPKTDAVHLIVATVLVTVVAIAEETIFRGYLILRFRTLTGSVGWAVLLSVVVFSLGHGYEGTAGVVTVGAMGLVFALAYIWRKSLVMPMTMHFLQDLLSVVLLPLLLGNQ